MENVSSLGLSLTGLCDEEPDSGARERASEAFVVDSRCHPSAEAICNCMALHTACLSDGRVETCMVSDDRQIKFSK